MHNQMLTERQLLPYEAFRVKIRGEACMDWKNAINALLPLSTVRNFMSVDPRCPENSSLRARYLQTATTVTPGLAKAAATFTIIYQ
ncbi:hypothetical protein RBU55_21530 [Pseudomonas chlororaphis subsp. aurantiaca]|uniref:fimbrial protein n=1 Tax=Pseudomonas chlororaphis TaxID=587753 RepID=UPI0027DAC853|nr:hypothetical protein [Pseudomonas chlororaphis]WMI98132.1 hypothetical protein RBU55_21530 [Pseudomonas chlororaphis subsp. aurantiaca]